MMFSAHRIADCYDGDYESHGALLFRLAARYAFFLAALPFCAYAHVRECVSGRRSWRASKLWNVHAEWYGNSASTDAGTCTYDRRKR